MDTLKEYVVAAKSLFGLKRHMSAFVLRHIVSATHVAFCP